jgi:uncharacterized protein YcfJ
VKTFFRDIGGAIALFKSALFSDNGKVTGEEIDAAGSLGVVTLKIINSPVFEFIRRIVEFSHRVDRAFNEMVEEVSKLSSDITGNKLIDPAKIKGASLIGKGIGGIAGFAAGTALGGPVVGMLGAFIGQWLGERIGGWLSVLLQAATEPDGMEKIMPIVIDTVSKSVQDFTGMVYSNSIVLGKIFEGLLRLIVAVLEGVVMGVGRAIEASVNFAWKRFENSSGAEAAWNFVGVIFSFVPVLGEVLFQFLGALLKITGEAFMQALVNPQMLSSLVGMVLGGILGTMVGGPVGTAIGIALGGKAGSALYSLINGGDYQAPVTESYALATRSKALKESYNDPKLMAKLAQVDDVLYSSTRYGSSANTPVNKSTSDAISRFQQQEYVNGVPLHSTTTRNVNITVDLKNQPANMSQEAMRKYAAQIRAEVAKEAKDREFREAAAKGSTTVQPVIGDPRINEALGL